MQLLSHALRKAVGSKKMTSTGYVGIALHVVEEGIGHKPTGGYIKNSILFVSVGNHGHRMLIHRDKVPLIQKINTTLKKYGYSIVVKDIRFTIRHSEAKPKNLMDT